MFHPLETSWAQRRAPANGTDTEAEFRILICDLKNDPNLNQAPIPLFPRSDAPLISALASEG